MTPMEFFRLNCSHGRYVVFVAVTSALQPAIRQLASPQCGVCGGCVPNLSRARQSELLRMNSELDARRAAAANRQRERAAAAAAVSSATAAATAATAGGSVDRTSTHTTARDRDRDGAAASHLPSRLPRRSAVARPMASTEATASAGASGGSAPVAVAVGGGASAGSPHRRRGSGRGAHHRGSPARAASPIRASGHTPTSTSTSARPRVRQSPGTGRADGRRTGREPADGSGARSGAPVASPHADADAAANGLGLEAKVAYQRARLTMLKDERDHAIAARKELEKEVKALRKAASGHSAAVAKLQRAVQVAEGQGKKDAKRACVVLCRVASCDAFVLRVGLCSGVLLVTFDTPCHLSSFVCASTPLAATCCACVRVCARARACVCVCVCAVFSSWCGSFTSATSQAKVESLTAQVKALRKDLDGQQRAARSASSESNSRDVRLQRALAEVRRSHSCSAQSLLRLDLAVGCILRSTDCRSDCGLRVPANKRCVLWVGSLRCVPSCVA